MDLITFLDALQTLAVPVLLTIGVTGGIKALVPRVPPIGPVPGGLWLSWVVALLWTAVGVYTSGGPAAGADVGAYIGAQWAIVAATANVVRNWMQPQSHG